MKILFWGTPAFALPALRALVGEGHDVVGVVTQPDRPAGRGRSLRPPPVKQVAIEEDIPVFQPERADEAAFLEQVVGLAADMSVVVAYGQILKRHVLDAPREGSINVHASILPELRGAAPINWAIARGHDATGVSVMRMVERMDAGPILHQVPEPIGPHETATDLTLRLSEIGAEALVEALALYEAGAIEERPQDEARATYAPRIDAATARVDWGRPALEVDRHVRAMDAVPGAWTLHDGQRLKLFRPLPAEDMTHGAAPGTVLDVEPEDPAEGMLVACRPGAVWVREVQPAGRRRMTTTEWLRGRSVGGGDRFE
ncbi:MAG: methionyl-tRNA formyltransferase [Gemmatimonadota bacterium]